MFGMTTTAIVRSTAHLPPEDGAEDGQSFHDAYAMLAADITAIPEAECLTVNTDPLHAAIVAIGASKALRTLEPEIRTHLPTVDPSIVMRLLPAAKALASAHTHFVIASSPRLPIREFDEELSRFRTLFMGDVRALAARNLIDASRLSELKSPSGHMNLAVSVLALCAHLRRNWPTIQGRSGVTLEELDTAERLGARMLNAVVQRDHMPVPLIPATLARKQAFTYLMRLYDDIQRVVSFLRWKQRDIDTWCPSLYYNKRTRKPRKKGAESPEQNEMESAAMESAPQPSDVVPGDAASPSGENPSVD